MGGARRVWVDTDVALGASARGRRRRLRARGPRRRRRERDAIELLGVSTVDGQHPGARRRSACAARLAEACGVEVRIVAGADGPRGRPGGPPAPALAALPDGCALVAIGPLSNLARGARRRSGARRRASPSPSSAGTSPRAGLLPPLWPHEFNLAQDRAPPARSSRRRGAARRLPARRRAPVPLRRPRASSASRSAGAAGAAARARLAPMARAVALAPWGRGGFPVWDLPPALEAIGALAVSRRAASRSPRRSAASRESRRAVSRRHRFRRGGSMAGLRADARLTV